MTAEEELLSSGLRRLGDGELEDAELDRRVTNFQTALRQLRGDPVEAARIDALVMAAELGHADAKAADSDLQHAQINAQLASDNLSSEQAVTAQVLAGPASSRPMTPAQIIGELLEGHPEAASLLAEASHCRALAVDSAAITRLKFAAVQAARLTYEELRHRLEPRRRHPINFAVGLLLLLVLSAGLAMLDLIELGGLLGGPRSVLPAMAATAVWVTGAWLAAVAVGQRRWAVVASIAGGGVLLGLLLVALHGFGHYPGWPAAGWRSRDGTVFGALAGVFILALTAGEGALMAYMEPISLLVTRRRWQRARTAYEKAVETEHADLQAAAAAAEAWLGLVRARMAAIAAGDENLGQATVAFAAVLVESSRPQLPPSL